MRQHELHHHGNMGASWKHGNMVASTTWKQAAIDHIAENLVNGNEPYANNMVVSKTCQAIAEYSCNC